MKVASSIGINNAISNHQTIVSFIMAAAAPTTPQLTYVPGRKQGKENVILNGYRFTTDRTRNNKTYMKCVLHSQGCRARITVVNRQLASPVPDHPSHDTQWSETNVHVAKQTLKQRAAETDLPIRLIVAESLSGMNFETRAKLNCQLSSLEKMARQSRKGTQRRIPKPTSQPAEDNEES